MRRAVRFVAACSLPIVLLAACGGDDEESASTTDETEETADETEETEATDDTEPDETDAPTDTVEDVTVPSMPELPQGEGDGCTATVEGDIELTFSAPDDQSAISYGGWMPANIREMLGFAEDQLLMNCISADGPGLSFVAGGETVDGEPRPGVPMEPATYVLPADAGLLGGGTDAVVSVFGGVTMDDESLFGLTEDGTLTITRFDDERIEGSFSLAVEEQFILDESEPRTATVQGTFSYTNFSE